MTIIGMLPDWDTKEWRFHNSIMDRAILQSKQTRYKALMKLHLVAKPA